MKFINDAGDKMSTPSSNETRTKWSSQNLSSQLLQLKMHYIRIEAVQNEANARLDKYAKLSKDEYELERYKVMAEEYRSENERKQFDITELSKKATKIKLKILEKEYCYIFNKEKYCKYKYL